MSALMPTGYRIGNQLLEIKKNGDTEKFSFCSLSGNKCFL